MPCFTVVSFACLIDIVAVAAHALRAAGPGRTPPSPHGGCEHHPDGGATGAVGVPAYCRCRGRGVRRELLSTVSNVRWALVQRFPVGVGKRQVGIGAAFSSWCWETSGGHWCSVVQLVLGLLLSTVKHTRGWLYELLGVWPLGLLSGFLL